MKIYNKKEAYQAVLNLKNGHPEQVDLDALLRYFAPACKQPKTAEQWAAKACADKRDIRQYLRYLYVKGGEMIATDGHRVHIVKTQFADGWYDPKTMQRVTGEVESYTYPDVRRAMNTSRFANHYPVDLQKHDSEVVLKGKFGHSKRYGPTWVNVVYADAVGTATEAYAGAAYRSSAIWGRSVYGEFYIMGEYPDEMRTIPEEYAGDLA